MNLPNPNPPAQALSNLLKNKIADKIQTKGMISFFEFMDLALYEPNYGYYRNGLQKFGENGDFVTAPELSPLFSRCLAKQCQQVLNEVPSGSILEFGPGSGTMAAAIIHELAILNALPTRYYLLELSGELKNRQQVYLQKHAAPFYHLFEWLDKLPSPPFQGVILANEILDAMPVHKLAWQDNLLHEYYVAIINDMFCWETRPANSSTLDESIRSLNIFFNNGYTFEINLLSQAWIKSLATILTKGIILIMDYGFPQNEYYHPERDQGTIMCHYQHLAHSDPLINVGLQDITAHVDFTAIARTAHQQGLTIDGFTNQAGFLINCGIDQLAIHSEQDLLTSYANAQQLKRLMLPSEMGELFKAIALSKDMNIDLLGFKNFNYLPRL